MTLDDAVTYAQAMTTPRTEAERAVVVLVGELAVVARMRCETCGHRVSKFCSRVTLNGEWLPCLDYGGMCGKWKVR